MPSLVTVCVLSLLLSTSAAVSEDWSNPKLDRSALQPKEPVVGTHDNFSAFTSDIVRVEWREHDPIYLHVMIPKGVRKPPVILYLYNFDSDIDRFQNTELATALTSEGVAAVGFCAALSGHRYHDRPMKHWFVSELQESLGKTAHDVQMIIDYLATRDDVDATRVGMFGLGSGGTIAILSAAVDPRIRAIGAINPWGDWPDWVRETRFIPKEERPGLSTNEFLNKVAPLDPVRFLPVLKVPIGLEFFNYKGAIPEVAREKIEAAAQPHAFVVSADQARRDYETNSGGDFLHWLKSQLRSQSSAAPPRAASTDRESSSTVRANRRARSLEIALPGILFLLTGLFLGQIHRAVLRFLRNVGRQSLRWEVS